MPREDTDITSAQAVFGSALALPGQIATDPGTSLDNFMSTIKATLSRSENLSTWHNTAAARIHPLELPSALLDASHVQVPWDGHVLPLAPPYDGPYTVLRKATQDFTIQMGAKEEVVSTSRLKTCCMPDMVPMLPRRRSRPLRSARQLGLPPRCPADHPCPPPTLPRVGEGAAPHGWPPPLSPRRGIQVGAILLLHFLLLLLHFPQWRHLLLLHFPLWRHLLDLHFPQWRHHHPSWCSFGWPRRPARRVRFQDQQKEPSPPAPCSQSETVFPSTPAGVFARSDWSSTKRPAHQRHRPSHLDLYPEVWGEPCGEQHSAVAVQQQHQVAPAT